MQNKLFISGCPRSGTTALWRLIKSLSTVAIGVERFNNLIVPEFLLKEEHFEKKRYFTYQEEDSHWGNLTTGAQEIYYSNLQKRYDNCKYVGDKVPKLFQNYNELFTEFPSAKVIFIFRNIFDVAQSYKVRLENQEDAWRATFDESISDWNLSLEQTILFKVKFPNNFICVEYEELFYTNFDFKRILDPLNLNLPQVLQENLSNEHERALSLDSGKVLSLSTLEKRSIMHNARFDLYKKLLTLKA